MPLIRIQTRKKPSAEPPPAPGPKPPSSDKGRGKAAESMGAGPAILAGALVGLLAIGAITVYVITQRPTTPAVAPIGPVSDGAGAATVAPGSVPPPLGAVPPLNADYPRQSIVAWVSGEAYTMEELETSVRVAKALSTISGDPVPEYNTPAMRDFQVSMLRREVDSLLMRQALRRSATSPPDMDVAPAVDGYLQQYGGTPEGLAAALAANGITREHLDRWFVKARDTQFFIQTQLMADKQPEEQGQAVQEWLALQWQTQDIRINFYEPATPASPSAAPSP